jgi:xylan 1,4-beta-xylosidase
MIGEYQMKYKNPILKGFYPDPSICRGGDTFYLVTSTFQFLPGVPIFLSKDLVNWTQIGHCITRPSQVNMKGIECSRGIFAPTIRFHEGKFYMITTNVTVGNFIVSTEDPAGEWSEPTFIDIEGIDPSFFFEDGRVYVQYASFLGENTGIGQVEIDLPTGKLLSEPVIISKGSGGRDVEGPHMYHIGEYYYLLTAEGGTREGHMVTIRRGDSIWGPFEECPHNPILSNRDKGKQLLQNVGHGDLVEDENGNWWMVALAVQSIKHRHHLGRETILMPVTWNEDGWPIVSEGYAESEIDAPIPLTNVQEQLASDTDHFDSPVLGLKWNSMREFIENQYSLIDRPGFLTLKVSEDSLDGLGAVSFIGQRQQDMACEVIVKMEFEPFNDGEEAGITIFGDNAHHLDLFLGRFDGETKICLRKKVSDLVSADTVTADNKTTVYLKITTDKLEYVFAYSFDGTNYYTIGRTRTKHVSSEVIDSPFTGVYIGMYATSNGKETEAKAYFDYFSYEITD